MIDRKSDICPLRQGYNSRPVSGPDGFAIMLELQSPRPELPKEQDKVLGHISSAHTMVYVEALTNQVWHSSTLKHQRRHLPDETKIKGGQCFDEGSGAILIASPWREDMRIPAQVMRRAVSINLLLSMALRVNLQSSRIKYHVWAIWKQ